MYVWFVGMKEEIGLVYVLPPLCSNAGFYIFLLHTFLRTLDLEFHLDLKLKLLTLVLQPHLDVVEMLAQRLHICRGWPVRSRVLDPDAKKLSELLAHLSRLEIFHATDGPYHTVVGVLMMLITITMDLFAIPFEVPSLMDQVLERLSVPVLRQTISKQDRNSLQAAVVLGWQWG